MGESVGLAADARCQNHPVCLVAGVRWTARQPIRSSEADGVARSLSRLAHEPCDGYCESKEV